MKNSPELTPLLLGLCRTTDKQDAPQVLRLWKLDMDDGELCALRDFPLRLHQSFYAHCVGSCSVIVPCPPVLAEQVRSVLSSDDGNVQNFSHIEWLNRLDASLSRVHRKFSC